MTDGALSRADLESVRAFMISRGAVVRGGLSASMLSGGRSNVTYVLADEERRWVLRRPPFGGLTPSAHDVAREHTVTSALVNSAVPVAAPVGLCGDLTVIGAPFTVAAFVDGAVVRTQDDLKSIVADEIDGTVDALITALAALHEVDVDEVGLGTFARRTGYGERQLRRWSRQWEHVVTQPRAAAAELVSLLRERMPTAGSSAIVHGDYRIDNVLLGPGHPAQVLAVIDWELSTLGDPVADVASMCAYRHRALDLILGFPAAWTSPSLPPPEEMAARYERVSCRSLAHWEFYMGLAFYKLAVISEGIHFRYRAGATRGDGFASAGDAVPELLAAGIQAVTAR